MKQTAEAILRWNQDAVARLMEENKMLRRRLADHSDKETLSIPHEDIGRGTYWAPDVCFQRYDASERIKIGNYCSIARGVTISTGGGHDYKLPSTFPFDAERTYRTTPHTTIGHDVWIGEGAYVGGGAIVESGCVVAARACITGQRRFPPYAIITGNPGEVKGYRFEAPVVYALLRIAWWDWPYVTIKERIDWFYKPVEEFIERFDEKNSNGFRSG